MYSLPNSRGDTGGWNVSTNLINLIPTSIYPKQSILIWLELNHICVNVNNVEEIRNGDIL